MSYETEIFQSLNMHGNIASRIRNQSNQIKSNLKITDIFLVTARDKNKSIFTSVNLIVINCVSLVQ